ncbi:MAG: hypothetical protein LBB21_04870 [Holosporaceae bacterium]|nr:hypothetical protein [Holosporaceae bacterium]
MKKRMEFATHEMVNVLQNISQNRENKRISLEDMKCAVAAAYLSIYPGTTMYATAVLQHMFAHFPHGHIACIIGKEGGKASVLWIIQFHLAGNKGSPPSLSPQTMDIAKVNKSLPYRHEAAITTYKVDANPSEIYSNLTIPKGEIKILIECFSFWKNAYIFSGGSTPSSDREVFGFFLMNPIAYGVYKLGYFNSVFVFTPKPGLFNENAPT